MRHKAQAIFEHLSELYKRRKLRSSSDENYSDYLIPSNISLLFRIEAVYDTFDKEKISYFEVIIYSNDADKDIMKFSINSAGGMIVREDYEVEGDKHPQEKYINLLVERFYLDWKFQGPISVKEIEPIPPGANPYNHDSWRQGSSISKHWEVMFTSNGEDGIENVRLINTKTGRRFDLDLYEAEKLLS